MKTTHTLALVLSLLSSSGIARAEEPAPDESFLPGPGGGDYAEADAGDGLPPLESTGMEDGGSMGCDCTLGDARPRRADAGLLGLGAGALLLGRRLRRAVARRDERERPAPDEPQEESRPAAARGRGATWRAPSPWRDGETAGTGSGNSVFGGFGE